MLEDCDITSNTGVGIAIHGPTANPLIRRTRIHDARSNGVWVYDGDRNAGRLRHLAYSWRVCRSGEKPHPAAVQGAPWQERGRRSDGYELGF